MPLFRRYKIIRNQPGIIIIIINIIIIIIIIIITIMQQLQWLAPRLQPAMHAMHGPGRGGTAPVMAVAVGGKAAAGRLQRSLA